MFTRNWYKAMAVEMARTTETYQTIKGSTKTLHQSIYTPYLNYNSDNYNYPTLHKVQSTLSSYGGVIFGTGNTPPTIDDTTLSGDMISGFSWTGNVSTTRGDNGATLTALYTVTNNNAGPITISEVALMCNLNESQGFSENNKALLERTVLDTPVTIPAGGIGQVEYTITINLPI